MPVTAPPLLKDSRLIPVWEKVAGGERLTREDGLLLFETDDLLGLGRIGDFAKRRRVGGQVFFVINRYVLTAVGRGHTLLAVPDWPGLAFLTTGRMTP